MRIASRQFFHRLCYRANSLPMRWAMMAIDETAAGTRLHPMRKCRLDVQNRTAPPDSKTNHIVLDSSTRPSWPQAQVLRTSLSKSKNSLSSCPVAIGSCPSGERRQPRAGFRKESSQWTRIKFHRGRTLAFSPPLTDNFSGLAFSFWRCFWRSVWRACNQGLLQELLTRQFERIRPA